MTGMTEVEFETALQEDLPRGQNKEAAALGVDRGLTSRWLSADEMVGQAWAESDGVLLGTRNGRVIGWNDDRHLLTIAGSRAGKGVSLIIPNLIFYPGSAVVVDPKGENAAITAGRRGNGTKAGGPGLGQDVYVLDPFGESGLVSSSFNPLHALKADSPDVVEDIGVFADALITHPDTGERHWTESAQALMRALILLVIRDPMFRDRRNLVTVRRLLTLTDRAIDVVCDRIVDQRQRARGGTEHAEEGAADRAETMAQAALIKMLLDQVGPYAYICTGMGKQLMEMGANERGSVLSAARTQTQWLDSPKMPAVLCDSWFDLADLKKTRMTLYLCLPATRMATHARWLRLMILLSIATMERTKGKIAPPVLFVLDEFPVLGYMQSIETAAGLMAGFGVKLWPIVQNLGQLKQHYSRSWETFIANSGVVTAFSIVDGESLKALSDNLGRTNIVEQSHSGVSRAGVRQGGLLHRDNLQTLPLLAEDEIRRVFARKKQRLLIFNAEDNPGVVRRFVYYAEKKFEGLYDRAPHHGAAP